ncbi:MAG: hypothetical protein QF578_00690 [Alphaproteobacteria bacterium]|jgi:hypothetical protein|nr:hypothetical protein [Alphaproteobacteria bacterium]MDP6816119.1 hypothetical protein [Alphaproteobacteria bacterium]
MTGRRLLLIGLMPALMLVGVHLLLQELADWRILDGRLVGPDAYMRLLRVQELADTGVWFDPVSERSNAPYGEVLHWTRPLDLLLLSGAAVAAPLLGFAGALFAWAAVMGPLLHIATLFLLLWAVRPMLEPRGLILLGLLFPALFFIAFVFAVGRPDHHALNMMLFVAQLGFAVRLARSTCLDRLAIAAAAIGALALWISIEGMVGIGLTLLALAAGWIADGRLAIRRAVIFTLVLTAGLTVALVLERPPTDLLAIEFDRISVVYLCFLAMIAGFCLLLVVAPDGRPGTRLLIAGAAAGVILLAVKLLFPNFFLGPMAEMHPLVREVWFANNAEVSPLLDPRHLVRSLPKAVAHLGLILFAVPAVILCMARSSGEYRRIWALLGLFLTLTFALTLREVRWMGYPQILCLPPCIALLQGLFARRPVRKRGLAAARAAAVIAVAAGPLVLGGLLRLALPLPETGKACEMPAISAWLDSHYAERPQRIVNFIYPGSELLYRTRHSVVATPYHRNTAGMVDTIQLLRASDPAAAQAIVERRRADLILICPESPEATNYRRTDPPSLLAQLEAGAPPDWLVPVALPPALAADFRLFQVRRGGF